MSPPVPYHTLPFPRIKGMTSKHMASWGTFYGRLIERFSNQALGCLIQLSGTVSRQQDQAEHHRDTTRTRLFRPMKNRHTSRGISVSIRCWSELIRRSRYFKPPLIMVIYPRLVCLPILMLASPVPDLVFVACPIVLLPIGFKSRITLPDTLRKSTSLR